MLFVDQYSINPQVYWNIKKQISNNTNFVLYEIIFNMFEKYKNKTERKS